VWTKNLVEGCESYEANPSMETERELSFVYGDGQVDEAVERVVKDMKEGQTDEIIDCKAQQHYRIELRSMKNPKGGWEMSPDEKFEAANERKLMANGFYKNGKWELALKKYKKALELLDDYKLSDEEKARAKKEKVALNNNIAAVHLQCKDWSKALEAANKALELDGGNSRALVRKGKALFNLARWDEAERVLEKIHEESDDQAEAKRVRALIVAKRKEHDAKEKSLYAGMFSKIDISKK
jgi:FK506-binding protein 4/5